MLGKGNKKINKKDQENTTALHYAVRYNHLHIVKLLLDYGAGKEKLEQLSTLTCIVAMCMIVWYVHVLLSPRGELGLMMMMMMMVMTTIMTMICICSHIKQNDCLLMNSFYN